MVATTELITTLDAIAAESRLLMNFHSSWVYHGISAFQMYKNPSKFAEVSNKFKGYDADLAIVNLVDFF
jgi:hypothetical protein